MFLEEHPSGQLIAKRTTEDVTPLLTQRELQQGLDDRFTPRHREVLTTAYEVGYYDPEDGATGEAISNELGISAATISQDLKAAERKLVLILLENDLQGGPGS